MFLPLRRRERRDISAFRISLFPNPHLHPNFHLNLHLNLHLHLNLNPHVLPLLPQKQKSQGRQKRGFHSGRASAHHQSSVGPRSAGAMFLPLRRRERRERRDISAFRISLFPNPHLHPNFHLNLHLNLHLHLNLYLS